MSDPLQSQYATSTNLSARIDFHRRFSTAPVRWNDWAFERMSIAPGARVVELGCGTGLAWRALVDRVRPDWRLLMTDFSVGMLREAKRITAALPCERMLAAVDAQAIPLVDQSTDVVMARHMLYHVPDRGRAFGEIRRVLSAEGVFYATTIGRDYMRQLDDVVSRSLPGAPSIFNAVGAEFGEENGPDQLRPEFSSVEAEVFEDELRVTDPDAVTAYLRSTGMWSSVDPAVFEAIKADVAREIEREGAFVVDGSAVLFTCHR